MCYGPNIVLKKTLNKYIYKFLNGPRKGKNFIQIDCAKYQKGETKSGMDVQLIVKMLSLC